MAHSADLQWQLIRENHSFLVKRDGILLSAEPANLSNRHSFKFSGLVNNKTVAVNADKAGKITLVTRKTSGDSSRFIVKSSLKTPLNRNMRSHSSRAARTIVANTSRAYYRRDLTKFAVARYHALNRSVALKKNPVAAKKPSKRRTSKTAKKTVSAKSNSKKTAA